MSGPKSSDYYLNPEQRRQLEEQRRRLEEQKLVKNIREKINKLSSQFIYPHTEFDEYDMHSSELMKFFPSDNGYSEVKRRFERIVSEMHRTEDNTKNQDRSDKLSESFDKLRTLAAERDFLLAQIRMADAENLSELKNLYSSQLEKSMDTDFGIIKSRAVSERDKLYKIVSERLEKIKYTENLPESLLSEISSIGKKLDELQDIHLLRNFNAVTVEPLIKKCRDFSEMFTEYEYVRSSYEIMCETENIPLQNYPCSREGITEMKKKISEMNENAVATDEQEYISKCIDEVMIGMGYELIGERSVTKKNGRKFRNELYTFSEGTAVNITYSAGGRITMELAGLDSADRLPTDDESELLCEEMESFCGEFTEFERRLAKKGVLSKHISILPPTTEYAQIINTSDYNMAENAAYAQLDARKQTRKTNFKRME